MKTMRPIMIGVCVALTTATVSAQGDSSVKAQSTDRTSSTSRSSDDSARRGLEEIIVTAQKQKERLQDVPVPVATIDTEVLAKTEQLRLQDYYNKIPGVSLTIAANGGVPVIAIRGITTGAGTNATVGVVVDEVSYGGSNSTIQTNDAVPDIDPGDLARVEVLRGPQGTLYGAASMGGLIKFVTVDPSTEGFSGDIRLSGATMSHSDDTGYSARGAFNVPVTGDLALRVSGFTTRDPGYIDNAQTGERDANSRDSDGGRFSGLWTPSDAFTLKVSALIQDSERRGTEDVDTALGKDPQQNFLRGSGIYDRHSEVYSATAVANLGSVELTSATGYSIDRSKDNIDLTRAFGGFFSGLAQAFYDVPGMVTLGKQELRKVSQEVRMRMPLGSQVSWLLGAYYTDYDLDFDVSNNAADATTGELRGVIYNNIGTGGGREYAAFTNLTFDVTEHLDVQVGGRFTDTSQHDDLLNGGPLALLFFGESPHVTAANLKSDAHAVTYLLTPRYKFSDDAMMYARFSSGYRAGGSNLSCGFPDVPCTYDPDSTQNYEVGFKGNTDGHRFSVDASLYYIDWKDVQVPNLLTSGGFVYTGNAGRAKSQGVEVSVTLKPIEPLTLSAWAAYNDAVLTEAFPSGVMFGRSGDRLPYSSRVSGNFSITHEFPLWGTLNGFWKGDVSYVGDRKGNFQATSNRESYPSYTQLDLQGGVRFEGWDIVAFATNITDERGVLRGGQDATVFPSYFTYIKPRTIGLSVSRAF